MAEIQKKVWKEYFEPLVSGAKQVDLCLAIFDVHEGDTLVIREWDKDKKTYTGRYAETIVTEVYKNKEDDSFRSQQCIDQFGFQMIKVGVGKWGTEAQ